MSDEPRTPRALLVVLGIGTVVGAVFAIAGSTKVGLPIYLPVAFAVVIVAINVFLLTYGPYRRRHPREPTRTAQALVPDPRLLADTAPDCRWVGAGRIRGWLGLLNASKPLVALSLSGSSLELRVRPAFLAAPFGVRPLMVEATSGEEIFPARGSFGSSWLGIRGNSGDEGYFATKDVPAILTLLSHRGFNVSWQVRKIPFL